MTSPADGRASAFLAALETADDEAARSLVDDLVAEGPAGLCLVMDELIPTALEIVGLRWEQNEWTIAQEHIATDICRRIVISIGEELPEPEPNAPSALVACAEGEWHSLASLTVQVALSLAGWRAELLGPSVSSSQLAASIFDNGPDLVALTCSMVANLPGARRMIDTAHQTGTAVVVGGRAFGENHYRSRRLGADAWVATASAVLDIPAKRVDIQPASLPDPPHQPELRLLDDATHEIVMNLSRHADLDESDQEVLATGAVWMLRTVHAALLCDDRDILREHIEWQSRRALLGSALPSEDVVSAVVAAMPPQAEVATQWLEECLAAAAPD